MIKSQKLSIGNFENIEKRLRLYLEQDFLQHYFLKIEWKRTLEEHNTGEWKLTFSSFPETQIGSN